MGDVIRIGPRVIGYHGATHLLTTPMRRAGCEYMASANYPSAWDIGHEALVRSLAQLPLAYLSVAGRQALNRTDIQPQKT